jgi:hypothetical protein
MLLRPRAHQRIPSHNPTSELRGKAGHTHTRPTGIDSKHPIRGLFDGDVEPTWDRNGSFQPATVPKGQPGLIVKYLGRSDQSPG